MDIIEYLTRNFIFEGSAAGMFEFQRSSYRGCYISRRVYSMIRYKKDKAIKKKPFVASHGELNHSQGLLQIGEKSPQLPNATSASIDNLPSKGKGVNAHYGSWAEV